MSTFSRLNKLTNDAKDSQPHSLNETLKKTSVLYRVSEERRREIGLKAVAALKVGENGKSSERLCMSRLLAGGEKAEEDMREGKQQKQVIVVVEPESDEEEEARHLFDSIRDPESDRGLAAQMAAVSLGLFDADDLVDPENAGDLPVGYVLYDSEDENNCEDVTETNEPQTNETIKTTWSGLEPTRKLSSDDDSGMEMDADTSEIPEAAYSLVVNTHWEDAIQWEQSGDSDFDEHSDDESNLNSGAAASSSIEVAPQTQTATTAASSAVPALLRQASQDLIDDFGFQSEDEDEAPAVPVVQPNTATTIAAINSVSISATTNNQNDISMFTGGTCWDLPPAEPNAQEANAVVRANKHIRLPNVDDLPSIRNHDLSSGDWMDCIVWDDTIGPKRQPDLRLIHDHNDAEIMTLVRADMQASHQGGNLRTKVLDVSLNEDLLALDGLTGGKDVPESELSIVIRRKRNEVARKERLSGYLSRVGVNDNDDSEDDSEEGGEDGMGGRGKASSKWAHQLPNVRHSVPGQRFLYAKTELSFKELRNFHRPMPHFDKGRTRIVLASGARTADASSGGVKVMPNANQTLRRVDLSAVDGAVTLLEYSERRPCFANTFGMGSRLCNFYRIRTAKPDADFMPPESDFGKTFILGAGEKSPFIATLEPERLYHAVNNAMFIAPLAQQRPHATDFLLVQPKEGSSGRFNKHGGRQCYLRQISTMFVVGQQEPNNEVFHPNTYTRSGFTTFLNDYMAYQIVRRFHKNKEAEKNGMMFSKVKEFFPTVNSTFLRKVVKAVADRRPEGGKHGSNGRNNATWHRKTGPDAHSLDELRNKITPEDVCYYESVQVGLRELYDAGIYRVCRTDAQKVVQALQIIERQRVLSAQVDRALKHAAHAKIPPPLTTEDKNNKEVQKSHDLAMEMYTPGDMVLPKSIQHFLNSIRLVAEKAQLTPWHVTSCYMNLHRRAGQTNNKFIGASMRLTGKGDPSGRGEAISFVADWEDEGTRRRRARAGDDGDGNKSSSTKNKAGYGGTDSDLRKLSMPESGEILRQLNYPASDIAKLGRWDRNMVIKQAASAPNGHTVLGGALAKYSRKNRNSGGVNAHLPQVSPALNKTTQLSINQIFEREIAVLSDPTPPMLDKNSVGSASSGASSGVVGMEGVAEEEDDSSSDEDEDDDIDDLGAMLEQETTTASKSTVSSSSGARGSSHEQRELESMRAQTAARESEMKQHAEKAAMASHWLKRPQRIVVPKPGWKPFKILKRTIINRLANGETRASVHYFKDPKMFEEHRQNEEKRRERDFKELQTTLSQVQDGNAIDRQAKEMRLRDETRANYKLSKERKDGLAKLANYERRLREEGRDFVYTLPEEKLGGPRCKQCRIKGHTPANTTKCPLYYRDRTENDAVKQDGLRLSLNRTKLNANQHRDSQQKGGRHGGGKRGKGSRGRRRGGGKGAGDGYDSDDPDDETYDDRGRGGKRHRGDRNSGGAAPTRAAARASHENNPIKRLNQLFGDIIGTLSKNQDFSWFVRPVNKKYAPNYAQYVKKPMDMRTMQIKKVAINKYTDRYKFISDFERIRDNSLIYNDAGHDAVNATSNISKAAIRLLDAARDEVSNQITEIASLEGLIKALVPNSKRQSIGLGGNPSLPMGSPMPSPFPSTMSTGGGMVLMDGGLPSMSPGVAGTDPMASPGAMSFGGGDFGGGTGGGGMLLGGMANPFGAMEVNFDAGGDGGEGDIAMQGEDLAFALYESGGPTPSPLTGGAGVGEFGGSQEALFSQEGMVVMEDDNLFGSSGGEGEVGVSTQESMNMMTPGGNMISSSSPQDEFPAAPPGSAADQARKQAGASEGVEAAVVMDGEWEEGEWEDGEGMDIDGFDMQGMEEVDMDEADFEVVEDGTVDVDETEFEVVEDGVVDEEEFEVVEDGSVGFGDGFEEEEVVEEFGLDEIVGSAVGSAEGREGNLVGEEVGELDVDNLDEGMVEEEEEVEESVVQEGSA